MKLRTALLVALLLAVVRADAATINDPNVAANIAAVKAASTAPVATDPALVVSISPNSAALAQTVAGSKTNNNAAPGATNVGALECLANASAPSWTEGNLVLHSVLLNGSQRNDVTSINGITPLMGNGVTGTGSLRITLASDTTTNSNPFNVGNKTNNNAAPGATNVGALVALANAAAPAWTEGNLVAESVDLVGNTRVKLPESTLAVTATAAVNTGFTLTLPAAGAGLFHYINYVGIVRVTNATATAAGTALTVTTTNLPGSPVFSFGNGSTAGGTLIISDIEPTRPLKSSASNTATTFVAPAAGAGEILRINVFYYAAP